MPDSGTRSKHQEEMQLLQQAVQQVSRCFVDARGSMDDENCRNWFIRKMERYQCKKCGLFFCAAHKSKGHHGCAFLAAACRLTRGRCRSLESGRALAQRHDDLSMSTYDGDYEV
eukprot:751414-Hanusia_phi.AAC.1